MYNLLHTYHPQRIFASFGFFSIHWYGLLIALGATIGMLVILQLAPRYKISKEKILDMAFAILFFGLIGARLYYVIYDWRFFINNPWDIFKFWQGGLAIYGAMIGGVGAIIYYGYKEKLDAWLLADLVAVALVIGQTIGRWGNYFNQELFGKPTDLPWGIPIDPLNRPTEFAAEQYFHPTFLYESILNGLLAVILIAWHRKRLKTGKYISGSVAMVYLIGYSLIRMAMETLRTDPTPFIYGIRWQMIASGIIFISAAAAIILRIRKFR